MKGFVLKELLRAFGVGAAAVAFLLVLFYNSISIACNIWLSRWTDDSFLRNTSQAGTAAYRERTAMYVGVYTGLGIVQGEPYHRVPVVKLRQGHFVSQFSGSETRVKVAYHSFFSS